MTPEEAIAEMKEAQNSGDKEAAHMQADDILCRFLQHLGHEDLVAEYTKVEKWLA